LEQYNRKEEYLEALKNQIHFKRAKNMVAEEIDNHIEDQKASYMSEGDDENIAMKRALEQMGNPIQIGKQLDKIHRPKLEWVLSLCVLLLCGIGIFALISLGEGLIRRQVVMVVVGFLLMFVVYFLDYTILGRYPKLIWMILLSVFFLYMLMINVNRVFLNIPFAVMVNGHYTYLYAYAMLLFPAYGGILYAYRNSGYNGIIKCLLFGLTAVILEIRSLIQGSVYLGFFLSFLLMLTAAIFKGWFKTVKRKSILLLLGSIIIFVILILFTGTSLLEYNLNRLQAILSINVNPGRYAGGYQMAGVRKIISEAGLFGGTNEAVGVLPGLGTDYILTYMIGRFGIVAGLLTVGLFSFIIYRMIQISLRQKNSLGMFIGLGCSLAFAVQGIIYIISNFGIQLIAQVNFPFLSYGGASMIFNFIILGMMLSVFRNSEIRMEIPYKSKFSININIIKAK
jgi:cell division protein FtsW (lipid II flippase)